MKISRSFLREFVNQYISLKGEEFQQFADIFTEINCKKGSILTESIEIDDKIILITKGIVREYSIINNEDHTIWINGVGEIVMDLSTLAVDSPNNIMAEALTNVHLLVAEKSAFEELMISMPKICVLMNMVYQHTLSSFQKHMLLLKISPTIKREEMLFKLKPFLFRKEVKVKHLASLLNVHPNSLSRIHNQKVVPSLEENATF